MQRRLFLGGALLSATAAATGHGIAATSGVNRPLHLTYLANRDHFPLTPTPATAATLRLERRPERRFDPQTVLVASSSGPLGYLPPAAGSVIAALLDAGLRLDARVAGHGPDGPIIQIDLADTGRWAV